MTVGSIQNYLSSLQKCMSPWGSVNRSEKLVDRKELSNQLTPKSLTSKFSFARLLKCVAPLLLTSNALATSSLRGGASSVQRRSLMQTYDLETCSPFSDPSLIDHTRGQCENTAGPDNCNQPELENFLKLVNIEVPRFLQPWECDSQVRDHEEKEVKMNGDCNDILCKYVADGNLTIKTNGTIPVPPSPTPDVDFPFYHYFLIAPLLVSALSYLYDQCFNSELKKNLLAIESGREIDTLDSSITDENIKQFNLDIAIVSFLFGLIKSTNFDNDFENIKTTFQRLSENLEQFDASNKELVLTVHNIFKGHDVINAETFKTKVYSKIKEGMQDIEDKFGLKDDDFKLKNCDVIRAIASLVEGGALLFSGSLGLGLASIGASLISYVIAKNEKNIKKIYGAENSMIVKEDLSFERLNTKQFQKYLDFNTPDLSVNKSSDWKYLLLRFGDALSTPVIISLLLKKEDALVISYLIYQLLKSVSLKRYTEQKMRVLEQRKVTYNHLCKKKSEINYANFPEVTSNGNDIDEKAIGIIRILQGQQNNQSQPPVSTDGVELT